MAHIVHICPRYRPAHGGVELFFEKLSEELVRRGHDVSVWTTDAATVQAFTRPSDPRLPGGPERLNGVEVRRFPVRYIPGQRYLRTAASLLPLGTRWRCDTLRWTPLVPALVQAASKAGRALGTSHATNNTASDADARSIDLVHAAGLPYSSILYAGVRLAESAGAPLVISPFTHVAPPGKQAALMKRAYLSPLNRQLLGRADRVFVQTEFERRTMIEFGLRPEAPTIVGLAADAADCTGGDGVRFRSAHGLPLDAVVVGHLANKSWDKGTVDLLDAAERLWQRGGGFRLVLAGTEMASFRERFARLQHRDRVVNLGTLTDDQRRDFYAAIDIFALPSYVESFGVSALEAALNHAAVIAYDHGGPGQIFTHGNNAYLARVGDLADLADGLRALVSETSQRTALADGGLRMAGTYTWSRSLGRAVAAYDELLALRR